MQAKIEQMKDLDELTSADKSVQWSAFKEKINNNENGAGAWKKVISENENSK